MLIRATDDATFECFNQEHHALLSGILAGAWRPSRLDPLLVQTIGLHDNPWRDADATPRFDAERGLPHDFITYPMGDKIALYRRGIDQLESVHPWLAYMVSRHYTTFSGTRDLDELQQPEAARRRRLEARIDQRLLDGADEALRWIKFFDIFSLHLCLTGPRAAGEAIPRWLRDPDAWTTAPDGTEFELRWDDEHTLAVRPWPFVEDSMELESYFRALDRRAQTPDECHQMWRDADVHCRHLELRPSC